MEILRNQTANTSTTGVVLRGAHENWLVTVGGTFDTATAKLQLKDHDGNWIDIPDASSTASEAYTMRLPAETIVRAVVSSVGASTSIDMGIHAIRS